LEKARGEGSRKQKKCKAKVFQLPFNVSYSFDRGGTEGVEEGETSDCHVPSARRQLGGKKGNGRAKGREDRKGLAQGGRRTLIR